MRIKKGYVFRQIDEETGVAAPVGEEAEAFGGVITLNAAGSVLWRRMAEGDVSPEQAAAALTEEFEVDLETARRDVAAFVEQARAAGVLDEPEGESGGEPKR